MSTSTSHDAPTFRSRERAPRPTERLYGRDAWLCDGYNPTMKQLKTITALALELLGEHAPVSALDATVMIERLQAARLLVPAVDAPAVHTTRDEIPF